MLLNIMVRAGFIEDNMYKMSHHCSSEVIVNHRELMLFEQVLVLPGKLQSLVEMCILCCIGSAMY